MRQLDSVAVLRELYASEINVRFESVWDAGIHWRVGDEYNGYVGTGTAEDWDSAIYEAADYASGYYEHSGFNAWWWSGARSNYWPKPDAPAVQERTAPAETSGLITEQNKSTSANAGEK